MKNKITLIAILLLSLFLSCKKESESTPTPSTNDLITASAWKIKNYTTNSTDKEAQALLETWNSELQTTPLTVTYSKLGTYSYSDNTKGTWELSGSTSILFDKGTADELTATIGKITSTEFNLTYSWEVNDSLTINVTEFATK